MESGGVGALVFECEGKKLALHDGASAQGLYALVRSLGFVTMTMKGEAVDADPNSTMIRPCQYNLPTNLVALHKNVYSPGSRRAFSRCFAELSRTEIFSKQFFYAGQPSWAGVFNPQPTTKARFAEAQRVMGVCRAALEAAHGRKNRNAA